MEFSTIKAGSGFKYIRDGKLYSRICTNKFSKVKYLRCNEDGCTGRAKIEGELLAVTYEHKEHDASAEINKRCLQESRVMP